MKETVWLQPPNGDPVEVEATPEVLVPLMVKGYVQTTAPEAINE